MKAKSFSGFKSSFKYFFCDFSSNLIQNGYKYDKSIVKH